VEKAATVGGLLIALPGAAIDWTMGTKQLLTLASLSHTAFHHPHWLVLEEWFLIGVSTYQ
jgi:hypothetical protein